MSDLTQEMASTKTLREWCRVTCAHYPNVGIKNMSTSFRDGLAFCAIIHKHRPDLIDFSSLSKDNVYQNNKLAFEVAETKLGIPAMLDPKEMVSAKVPDCLSVITYLSQYYSYFNRKSYGPTSPDGMKPLKSSSHLETGTDGLSNTRPRTACNLCFRPVHLIQRHLIDGKIYHRSCFRCTVCHSTLLPECYTQGSDAGSLICTHHITDSKSSKNHPKCKFQAGYFYSLDGLAITAVPHYTKKTESRDRLVCKTPEREEKEGEERSREVRDRENRDSAAELKSVIKDPGPPQSPLPSVKDRTVEEALVDGGILQEVTTQQTPELSSPHAQVTEGSGRPIPEPRGMSDSPAAPAPAAGNSSIHSTSPLNSSRSTSPTSGRPKVKTKHPWLTIIHPGPWTQLPPAPAPVPTPRSKAVYYPQGPWYRPKVSAPNPFREDMARERVKARRPESTDQIKSSVEASRSEDGGSLTNKSGDMEVAASSGDAENSAIESVEGESAATNMTETPSEQSGESENALSVLDEVRGVGGSLPDVTEAAAAAAAAAAAEPHVEAQSHFLARSLSVPAITSAHSQSSFLCLTETNESATSSQSKLACKENPFDRKPARTRSKTFQDLPSSHPSSPEHGFPLIKRKVQTDQCVSTEELQAEMGELDKQLWALEQRGVELERKLRDCKKGSVLFLSDKEEERMLMEWFSVIHERQALVRRDKELVYLTKQQRLEERQADVEYEFRCLYNKPESDWSQEDRGREQQLMDELVDIIDQRNQIISSLDQDRQRERDEDRLQEASMKDKELQKDKLKQLKKSKGKFKPTIVFKILNHKAERTKDSMDKKS
ncbi:MICAL-like protein 1 isoform X2 [Lates calcarifer]|uniref:MICAL-like protein 1 isoform X2 n=1 Tax=Lates calcarifer TaxID=8187 RepID=A0AAJ7LIJ9_LATCA|nr:MICAL-like protein 1 isoform X2 [Lates calcarifer]